MTAHFTLRVADSRDFAAVSTLLETSYPKLLTLGYEPLVLARALPLMTRANPRLLASGTFYLAETGRGQLIGCGGWTKEQPGSAAIVDGEAHVRHFATHPDWIRRGVGGALLVRCLRDATAAGVRGLQCHSSLVAVEFYRASGFVPVRPIDLELTSEVYFPSVLLRRELT
jgi:N-acetylglutamate synthase-like GNAT family acetyltransferase